jgi:caa(3)-type oxidase subunit IV
MVDIHAGESEMHTGDYVEAHGPSFKAYMVVFGALSIFTAISFVVNDLVRNDVLTSQMGFFLILAVAIVKALLVAIYFMHLIVDWGKLYYFIFPTFILGTMFMIVLLPDIVLAWHDAPSSAAPAQKAGK